MPTRPWLLTLTLLIAGCDCGGPPLADAGVTGGGSGGGAMATGGGAATGGGLATGGGTAAGGGGGAMEPEPNRVQLSSSAGRVSGSGLTADVQLGLVPAPLRASGGALSLEGVAVIHP